MAARRTDPPGPEVDVNRGRLVRAEIRRTRCRVDHRVDCVYPVHDGIVDAARWSKWPVTKRGKRELSTNLAAQIPALEEAWAMLEATPPVALAPRRRRVARRGILATTDEWAARHPTAIAYAVRQLARNRAQSEFAQVLDETLAQLAVVDPGLPLPPVIASDRGKPAIRYGFFHALTDRDAFTQELLGRPVPSRPRFLAIGPRLPVDVGSIDLSAAPSARSSDVDRLGAVAAAAPSVRDKLRSLLADPGLRAAGGDLAGRNPVAFAELAAGEILHGAVAGQPLWNLPGPGADAEFARVYPMGQWGWIGLAWWMPGDFTLRKHRRSMAAHLRYLFDHVVSPWNRWSDARTRTEVATLLWRKQPGTSMERFATELRDRHPARYEAEALDVTIRRLYRLNARIGRERKLVAEALRWG